MNTRSPRSQWSDAVGCGGGNQNPLEHVVDALHASEMALRSVQAARLRAVWALMSQAGCDNATVHAHAVAAEIGALLHVSTRAADHLMADTAMIMDRPAVFAALADGRLDLARCKTIVLLLALTPVQEALEPAAISYGTEHTNHQLRLWLLAQLPEAASDNDRRQAHGQRRVDMYPCASGMSVVQAYLPTERAAEFFEALDSIARSQAGDDRTMDQRRADAIGSLLDDRTVVRTQVSVVLPASGVGASVNNSPVPWDVALNAATAKPAAWSAWLTDAAGRVIKTTPQKYRIPAGLARTVRARDATCRFPGCAVPAGRCDIDHTIAFPLGLSVEENLHCLCRRHHRIKHQSEWTVRNVGDNELEWTSPSGKTYRTTPPNWLDETA